MKNGSQKTKKQLKKKKQIKSQKCFYCQGSGERVFREYAHGCESIERCGVCEGKGIHSKKEYFV